MNNEFIISGELTPLSWGIIGFVLLFAAQLLLCLKAKRKAVKCIPLYLIGCALLYGIATYTGLLGSYCSLWCLPYPFPWEICWPGLYT